MTTPKRYLRLGNHEENGMNNAPDVKRITPPCMCATEECKHASDCAVHNEPAFPAGECSCRVSMTPAELRAQPGAHYSDGRRYSRISKAWIFAEDWNDREEVAFQCEIAAERDLKIAALLADRERLAAKAAALTAANAALAEALRETRRAGDPRNHSSCRESRLPSGADGSWPIGMTRVRQALPNNQD